MTNLSTVVIDRNKRFPTSACVVRVRLLSEVVQSDIHFTFRSDRKWHRVQKVCFWLLRKIGAFKLDTVETVQYSDLQAKDLHTLIQNSIDAVLGGDWGRSSLRDDLVVCVGSADWAELLREYQHLLFNPFSYNTGPWRTYDGLDKVSSPFGIQVAVIPWIKGVVVVPRSAVKQIV